MRGVLEEVEGLWVLQIDDGRSRINREAPQLVRGHERVIERFEPMPGYSVLPLKGVVEGRFGDHDQRILSAVDSRLTRSVVPPPFG